MPTPPDQNNDSPLRPVPGVLGKSALAAIVAMFNTMLPGTPAKADDQPSPAPAPKGSDSQNNSTLPEVDVTAQDGYKALNFWKAKVDLDPEQFGVHWKHVAATVRMLLALDAATLVVQSARFYQHAVFSPLIATAWIH